MKMINTNRLLLGVNELNYGKYFSIELALKKYLMNLYNLTE